MPKTAASTKTQCENATENPTSTAKRQIVHVTLIFDGVSYVPKEIYEALDTKFGTVKAENDSVNRGNFVFNIAP